MQEGEVFTASFDKVADSDGNLSFRQVNEENINPEEVMADDSWRGTVSISRKGNNTFIFDSVYSQEKGELEYEGEEDHILIESNGRTIHAKINYTMEAEDEKSPVQRIPHVSYKTSDGREGEFTREQSGVLMSDVLDMEVSKADNIHYAAHWANAVLHAKIIEEAVSKKEDKGLEQSPEEIRKDISAIILTDKEVDEELSAAAKEAAKRGRQYKLAKGVVTLGRTATVLAPFVSQAAMMMDAYAHEADVQQQTVQHETPEAVQTYENETVEQKVSTLKISGVEYEAAEDGGYNYTATVNGEQVEGHLDAEDVLSPTSDDARTAAKQMDANIKSAISIDVKENSDVNHSETLQPVNEGKMAEGALQANAAPIQEENEAEESSVATSEVEANQKVSAERDADIEKIQSKIQPVVDDIIDAADNVKDGVEDFVDKTVASIKTVASKIFPQEENGPESLEEEALEQSSMKAQMQEEERAEEKAKAEFGDKVSEGLATAIYETKEVMEDVHEAVENFTDSIKEKGEDVLETFTESKLEKSPEQQAYDMSVRDTLSQGYGLEQGKEANKEIKKGLNPKTEERGDLSTNDQTDRELRGKVTSFDRPSSHGKDDLFALYERVITKVAGMGDALDTCFEIDREASSDNLVVARVSKEGGYIKDDGQTMSYYSEPAKTISLDEALKMTLIQKEKGMENLMINGTKEFKNQLFLAASLVGLKVQNYEPPEEIMDRLEALKKDKNLMSALNGAQQFRASPKAEALLKKHQEQNSIRGVESVKDSKTTSAFHSAGSGGRAA